MNGTPLSTRDSTPLSARRRRQLLSGQLWGANVLIGCGVASLYLSHAPHLQSLRIEVFLYLGLVSCAAILSLLPGLLVMLAAQVLPERALGFVSALLWTIAHVLVFVDTYIYGLFRYHFNGMVWNVMTTPGADEAVHVSGGEKAVVLVGALALFAAELGLFHLLRAMHARSAGERAQHRLLARPIRSMALVLLPITFLVTGNYAYSDLVRDRNTVSLSRIFPVYPRLKVKRFARDYLGVPVEGFDVDVPTEGILLDYPKEPLAIPPGGPRPNVVVVVIDSLRADMLSREAMPRTYDFSSRARVFRDHFSGGNATRFGLFSLIYGLHGSYWHPIYNEHRSPVLIDALLDLGYDTTVLTSASMTYPEFSTTAWVRVQDSVEDRLAGGRPGARDDGIARRFEEWLEERAGREDPFFAFLLLDAPHQVYDFPRELAVFEPYAERVSYLEFAHDPSPEDVALVFNRYRNAVHYADQVVGRILDSLASHGALENSLVAITGDHGEEFFENGFFGHTSNFTREQVHVPFVLSGPGVPPGEELEPTSHVDFPATVLELLGADPGVRAGWTLGLNLMHPSAERRRVVSGWDTLGLCGDGVVLLVPMALYGGSGIDVYDERWRLVEDAEALLRREGPALGNFALECRRFLK